MSDERLHFALGILDGEPDAHRVVADLLEEQGEPGLADWARGRKNNGRKRLEFAIGLLPPDAAVRLGCDFAEHVLNGVRRTIRVVPQILNAVASIRESFRARPEATAISDSALSWAEFLVSQELLDLYDENITRWERQFTVLFELRAGLERLSQTVRHVLSANEQRRDGNERKAVHLEHQARVAVRKLARRMREAALPAAQPQGTRRRFFGLIVAPDPPPAAWVHPGAAKADELRWQMERTRVVIEELLQESPAR
jgi:hypothetical protein